MPAQVTPSAWWTAIGVGVSLIVALGSAAYTYGRRRQRTDDQESTIEGNQAQLEELADNVENLNDAIIGLSRAFVDAKEELEANRRDIVHQNRIIHDQFLENGETCGNPTCVYCHPAKNPEDDIDIDVPNPDADPLDAERWSSENDD